MSQLGYSHLSQLLMVPNIRYVSIFGHELQMRSDSHEHLHTVSKEVVEDKTALKLLLRVFFFFFPNEDNSTLLICYASSPNQPTD